jgi:hypothetical protein
MLMMWFESAKETPETSVLEPNATSKLPKTADGAKSRPMQNKVLKWM